MSRGTLDPGCSEQILHTRLSLCIASLPRLFCYPFLRMMPVQTPRILRPLVWPLPRSLATTYGISVDFFSSPYLDVSVQAVPHHALWIHAWLTRYGRAGLPHSVIPGYNAYVQLPEAYRSLSRLSSAPDAKAFPLRSF